MIRNSRITERGKTKNTKFQFDSSPRFLTKISISVPGVPCRKILTVVLLNPDVQNSLSIFVAPSNSFKANKVGI